MTSVETQNLASLRIQYLFVPTCADRLKIIAFTASASKEQRQYIFDLVAIVKEYINPATSNLDIDETDAALAQIRTLKPEIVERLQKLAQGYQFEQIIQLLKTVTQC